MKTRGFYKPVNPDAPRQPRKPGQVLRREELLKKHQTTVEMFDRLPASAMIPNGAVAALEGISMPSFWNRVKAGLLPKPHGKGSLSRSQVGEVREYRAKRLAA